MFVSDEFRHLSKSEVGRNVLKLKRMTVGGEEKQNEEKEEEEEEEENSEEEGQDIIGSSRELEGVKEVIRSPPAPTTGIQYPFHPEEKNGGRFGGRRNFPLSQTNGEVEPTIEQMIKKVPLKIIYHLEFKSIFHKTFCLKMLSKI